MDIDSNPTSGPELAADRSGATRGAMHLAPSALREPRCSEMPGDGAVGTTATGGPDIGDVAGRHRRRSVRDTVSATVGTMLGLVPHVLHHIGLLAGTALVAGAGGNAVLYLLGLLFTLPLLRRLRRRFDSWLAPAIAVAVFSSLFALSAFVIGPAISGAGSPSSPAQVVPSGPGSPVTPSGSPGDEHAGHHS